MEKPASLAARVIGNVEKVIVGKRREVEQALLAVICQGHLLVEDVPGVGKTTLAKAISRSLGLSFRRIQFTPDLLPSDVTGVSIYNQKNGEFEFRPGPVIAQIVLADEINRATPRTQSALLEAMEERQVTVDGYSHQMPKPFLVMATQNPIEYEGTFPLPEAQLDRFLMRINLGYLSHDDEVLALDSHMERTPIDDIDQVIDSESLVRLQDEVRKIYVDPAIKQYIVSIVHATRHHPEVYLGASLRGSLALLRTGQGRALLDSRDYVSPDDIKALCETTLAHRLIISPSARIKNVSAKAVVAEVVDSVPVPGTRVRSA